MHHIKHDARKTAYDDPYNPFGRRRQTTKRSSTSRIEEGHGASSVLSRSITSPDGPKPVHAEIPDYQGQSLAHATTSQDNYGGQSSGDRDFEMTMSPQSTHADSPVDEKKDRVQTGSDDTEKTYTSSTGVNQSDVTSTNRSKRKLMSFFGGKGTDRRDEAHVDDDNNNGKAGKKHHFTVWSQIRATLFGSWINVLLILSPVGIALHFAHANMYAVFVVNFIAIIPLAGMLSYATEEIALRTGEVIGGLLNATFGNAVELIVSIIALFQNQFLIVQTSLIGSILSNLLLVMGMCFFAGGINRMEQAFNMTVAQTASSLLFLAVSSLVIPTAFEAWAQTGDGNVDRTTSGQELAKGVVELSRGTSIILLFIYGCYLFFQLKSHVSYYMAPSEKNKKRDFTGAKQKWKKVTGVKALSDRRSSGQANTPTSSKHGEEGTNYNEEEEEDEAEEPQLSLIVAIITLAASTVLVALNAEFLVDSINEVTCSSSAISKTFIGLILLPIVGNAAEHATAITVAIKDKMDLAIGVAVGSSMQIALLVLPLVVVIGWIAGKDDMNLYFDGFQLAMLFVTVLLVNYLIQDGKSHWLEGLLLMMLYVIIAVAAWFYPTDPRLNNCPAE